MKTDDTILLNTARTVEVAGAKINVAELPHRWARAWRGRYKGLVQHLYSAATNLMPAIAQGEKLEVDDEADTGAVLQALAQVFPANDVQYLLFDGLDEIVEAVESYLQMQAGAEGDPPISLDEWLQDRTACLPREAKTGDVIAVFFAILPAAYPLGAMLHGAAKTS